MNKYQEAYSYIKHYCELDDDFLKWPLAERSMKTFQELVYKATPKKPILSNDPLFAYMMFCPICKKSIPHKHSYCGHCGQAVDWSDESE